MKLIKLYKNFKVENLFEAYFDSSWVESDPKDSRIHAIRIWRKELSMKGFNCLIREMDIPGRNSITKYVFYIEDVENDTLSFMDYLFDTPIGWLPTDLYMIDLNAAIRISENQLDFYKKIKEFPSEKEIIDCLYPFTDEQLHLSSDIKYGYEYNEISDPNNYELVQYHKIGVNLNFICCFFLEPEIPINKDDGLLECINEFKLNIEEYANSDYKITHFSDSRGIVICIRLV